jgi:soluble lytic murein transglycosylase-like protein
MELKITNELKHFSSTPEIDFSKKSIANKPVDESLKLKKAAQDFESLFTSMMLKSMSQTTEGLFGKESFGGDFYSTIFENEIASEISKGKGIGIADFIYKKLESRNLLENSENKINESPPIKMKTELKDLPDIIPGKNSLKRLSKYEHLINEASTLYGVDKNLIRSVILTESAANEKAISKAKAKGLMQLMDGTAKDMGVKNVWNPKENIFGGTKYLAQMLRQYKGDVKLTLASYNAGPGNVAKFNGIPPFEETKNYITRVLGYLNHLNG